VVLRHSKIGVTILTSSKPTIQDILNYKFTRDFLSAYQQVRDTIHQDVIAIQKKYPNIPIKVTGHSLGGACSVLCAFDLVDSKLISSDKISVVNIGQPRVGDQNFATAYNKHIGSSYRVVNARDLVPHVPPQLFGFEHSSTEIWFSTNYTNFTICDGSGEDPNCSDSLNLFNPSDHLWYCGFYAHLPGAIAAHCGPIPHVSDIKKVY